MRASRSSRTTAAPTSASTAAPAVLQGEAPGRVLLVGSASLALAPGLRCGSLVVPPRLAPRALELRAALDGGSPAPEQLALARLLATGGYERHVRRVRAEYARRRDALVAALRERFGADAVGALDAGLHVALALPEPVDRAALATRAAAARVRVVSLEEHRHEPPPYASTLLVGHARVPGAAASEAVRLARLVDPTTAPGAARALPRRPSVRADAGDLGRGAPGQTSRTLRVLTLDLRGAPEELVPAFVRAVEAAEADVLLLQNTLGRTQRFVRALGWPHAIRALNIAARVRLVRPGAAPLALAEVDDEDARRDRRNIHLSDEAYGPWALAAGAGPAQAHDAERRIRLPELAAAVAPLARRSRRAASRSCSAAP